MPLQQIARQIITLADTCASTPVLVTPSYLSFRREFFFELSRELAAHTDRDLRIDWYRDLPGVRTIISDQLAAWHVKSVNRLLSRTPSTNGNQTQEAAIRKNTAQQTAASNPTAKRHRELHMPAAAHPQKATLQITARIARPGGKGRDLVIGLSDVRQKLPEWTTAIWLGTSKEELKRWNAA